MHHSDVECTPHMTCIVLVYIWLILSEVIRLQVSSMVDSAMAGALVKTVGNIEKS